MMFDEIVIKKAIKETDAVLKICISDMATGSVYVRNHAELVANLLTLKTFLVSQLPVEKKVATKVVAKKTVKSVKGKESIKGL